MKVSKTGETLLRWTQALLRQTRGLHMVLAILAKHRLRTALAVLGVFLGALLLTSILHILTAVNLMMEQKAVTLGSHIVTVTAGPLDFIRQDTKNDSPDTASSPEASINAGGPDSGKTDDKGKTTGSSPSEISQKRVRMAATLTLDDITEITNTVPQIAGGVPFTLDNGSVMHNNLSYPCQLLGTTENYPQVRTYQPINGRFFSQQEVREKALVCVLGISLAKRLFSDADKALGKYLRVNNSLLFVMGVMEEKGQDTGGTKLDEMVIMPVTTYMQRFSNREYVTGFFLNLRNRNNIELVRESLKNLLRQKHHLPDGKDDFILSFSEQVDEFVGNAMRLIRTLGIIGSTISFAIGTLGILSVMTLLVRSRQLEIGVRRAVGATKKQIIVQFMGEAAVMAGAGGIIGVIVALLLSALLALMQILPAYYNIPLAGGVCFLSIICGIIAGAYPAWQAAKTDVLQTLRDM